MGKLVRDKFPDKVKAEGKTPIIKQLNFEDYLEALCDLLVEDATSFKKTKSVEDLANCLELIMTVSGTEFEYVCNETDKMRANEGGFGERLYLEGVVDIAPITKETEEYTDSFDLGYNAGWNDCLKKLGGQ